MIAKKPPPRGSRYLETPPVGWQRVSINLEMPEIDETNDN